MPVPLDALSITDLRVSFAARTVLDGLCVSAAPGAITALLGPNGAGKTTTIRCCTGLVTPDSGTVTLLGQPPAAAIAAGRVGVMPQTTGAWSGVRPVELLRYLASLYAHPLPVDDLVAQLGIDGFAGTTYRRLSGGQRQLVNLAGAIIGRPELVFLDEPTAGLDPHVRRQVWSLIEQLRAAGVAVVLTTHHMDEVERLADQVWIMDHGRVRLSGTVAELTADQTLEEVFLAVTDPGASA